VDRKQDVDVGTVIRTEYVFVRGFTSN